jgi:hypothetical protein
MTGLPSAHIFRDRALESIALYSLVYWDVTQKFYHSRCKNMVLAPKIRNKLLLHLPAAHSHF